MPNITASGVAIPQGTDAFTPPTQFKVWGDTAATYENRVVVALDSDRTALAAPVLRDGLECYVKATGIAWLYAGTTWVQLMGPTNMQLDTTNSLVRTITQIGIGRIAGNNTGTLTETVTFPVPFTTPPVMSMLVLGSNAAAPFTPTGTTLTGAYPAANALLNTGFTANILAPSGTLSSATFYYYSWTAVGTV